MAWTTRRPFRLLKPSGPGKALVSGGMKRLWCDSKHQSSNFHPGTPVRCQSGDGAEIWDVGTLGNRRIGPFLVSTHPSLYPKLTADRRLQVKVRWQNSEQSINPATRETVTHQISTLRRMTKHIKTRYYQISGYWIVIKKHIYIYILIILNYQILSDIKLYKGCYSSGSTASQWFWIHTSNNIPSLISVVMVSIKFAYTDLMIYIIYHLVMTNIAMENHHFE